MKAQKSEEKLFATALRSSLGKCSRCSSISNDPICFISRFPRRFCSSFLLAGGPLGWRIFAARGNADIALQAVSKKGFIHVESIVCRVQSRFVR